ncbi:EAL domain-containing protein [Vibrio europaeus]|uniref:Diguanylate cyclase n=1 Tax=Vibrio europaeus TaxID=300876 RepID=A0A178J5A2_9VIBR|nr:EAL domain-containing protein [Vibrio europaeus]MDC5706126.1 EAL domain-containing protein [Vibrio europaeus]MDC5709536.1 EAL domain-containing protein [Vibrio europaeus]MDC5713935.1 EAL domain-containing protein [Vibrio europaeus]MDC5720706.1 EAL domain-containing protein [Vibrio europaeus]MDC5723456.1 EAL domain-containing protein [Vibrio europaeus]
MVRTTSVQNSLSVETINDTLSLDGQDLLNKATLELQQYSNSFCTCIIELDQFTNRSTLLASSSGVKLQRDDYLAPLTHSTCTIVIKSNQDYIVCDSNAKTLHPNEQYISEHDIESYLAIPLKTSNGEVLGILLSAYTRALDPNLREELIYNHKLFANIVTHNLKSKWLTARSETLVDQLSYEVSHDNLTGLLNRSYLSDKLERLSQTQNIPFTLAYLDIDNFKSINDLYGNYIGDQLIKFVANTIKEAIKDEQFAFRIAGDEFAFITQASDPFKVCYTIIKNLEKGYQDPSHKIKFTASIGLAKNINQSLSADQIILNASLALKDCKQSRHVHVQCYDTHLSAQYYRKALIIDALRTELAKESISDSELYVAVQPIVERDNNNWDYFEVLARWQSHALGTISPLEFIDAAEQSGLIVELGEHIVELACKAKLALEKGLGHGVRLSLNCSAHELHNSNRYLQHLLDTIKHYGFKPDEFTIELTETVLLSQTEEVKKILNKLRFLGFKVALDDFGTGYSSLNYIHSYPIDCIKIDATFIRNMHTNETAERVVWLIVQLAKQLNLSLVAEGVEDQEALEKLYDMGCSQIQGYYFSKPDKPQNIINQSFERITQQQQVSNG